jgi:hypothetical protein
MSILAIISGNSSEIHTSFLAKPYSTRLNMLSGVLPAIAVQGETVHIVHEVRCVIVHSRLLTTVTGYRILLCRCLLYNLHYLASKAGFSFLSVLSQRRDARFEIIGRGSPRTIFLSF